MRACGGDFCGHFRRVAPLCAGICNRRAADSSADAARGAFPARMDAAGFRRNGHAAVRGAFPASPGRASLSDPAPPHVRGQCSRLQNVCPAKTCAAACARSIQPSAKRLSRENLRRRMYAASPIPSSVSEAGMSCAAAHARSRLCRFLPAPTPGPQNKKAPPRPAKRPSKAIQAPNAWRQPMFPPARARADTIPRRQARAQA